MLRRILIILLIVVVIIAAIFAIRWFLNRDSSEADAPEGEVVGIVDESGSATGEEDVVDQAPETEEITPIEEIEASVDAEGSEAGYPPATEGEGAAEGEDAGEGESVAPAEGEETAPSEGTDDQSLGGVADSGDAEVGGGVPEGDAPEDGSEAAPEEGGETATEESGEAVPAEESSDADAPAEGTGGVGDVAAVSPAAAFVQPGVPAQHVAENQEWLTQLARCYGTTVADIQAANNYTCPDLIHPGYVVNIPNPGNAGPITINDAPCFLYHTVQTGETLYSIATQYGLSYQWLARINVIYNYDYIYAGQQLVIPNPVDPVFTQMPPESYFYSDCWYGDCPVYPVHPIYPVPEPYGK